MADVKENLRKKMQEIGLLPIHRTTTVTPHQGVEGDLRDLSPEDLKETVALEHGAVLTLLEYLSELKTNAQEKGWPASVTLELAFLGCAHIFEEWNEALFGLIEAERRN